MDIIKKPMKEIHEYAGNPRSNTKTVEALQYSIKRYGFNVPIVVDTEGVIIAGHARYKAAQAMKLKKVPCVVVDLPEAEAKKYRLADNRIQDLSKWREQDLIFEVREIGSFEEFPWFNQRDRQLFSSVFEEVVDMPEQPRMRINPHKLDGVVPPEDGLSPENVGGDLGNYAEPEMKLKGGVTQSTVDKTERRMREKFTERDKEYRGKMINVSCKCCGETFSVLRQDLERIQEDES